MASKQPNEYHLYDMSGNVTEWVEDCWTQLGEECGALPEDGSPILPKNGCVHGLMRGGSSKDREESQLRVDAAECYPYNESFADLGFRVARDVP